MNFFNRKMAEGRSKIAYWQVSFGNIFPTLECGSKTNFADLLCIAKYYISYVL
jgi:hypothetical protein